MANTYTSNPVEIQAATPGTSFKAQLALAGYGSFQFVGIRKVRWIAPSVAGNKFVISDPNTGRPLIWGTCSAANVDVDVTFDPTSQQVSDFTVTELDSGTLLIYLV